MKTSRQPLLIVISAPSGGGKTTLCQQLLARHRRISRAITCTTRAPRPGEQAGVDYYFLTPAAFRRKLKAGGFLEHARVHGRLYGTPKQEVMEKLEAGLDVLLNIDVQGAFSIAARAAAEPVLRRALVTVFLTPATIEELEARLKRRGTDSEADLKRRLRDARLEIAQKERFQHLIVSTTIEGDVRRMEAVLRGERARRRGRADHLLG